jgi:Tol biopolymer transport system component
MRIVSKALLLLTVLVATGCTEQDSRVLTPSAVQTGTAVAAASIVPSPTPSSSPRPKATLGAMPTPTDPGATGTVPIPASTSTPTATLSGGATAANTLVANATAMSTAEDPCLVVSAVDLNMMTVGYVAQRDGISWIYSQNVGGQQPPQVITEGVAPIWSPDGKHLAFLKEQQLYVMTSDGRTVRVTPDDIFPVASDFAWAPDSRSMAFIGISAGRADLFVVDIDGDSLVNITRPYNLIGSMEPAWSSDGTRLAFIAPADHLRGRFYRLHVVEIDGSSLELLDSAMGDGYVVDDGPPQWHPWRPEILLASRLEGDHPQIIIFSGDGKDRMQLTDTPLWKWIVAWSPTGHAIAYDAYAWDVATDGGRSLAHSGLYVVDRGGDRNTAVVTSDHRVGWFAWAPDGRHIAYTVATEQGTQDLNVVDYCTGQISVIAQDVKDYPPNWRP